MFFLGLGFIIVAVLPYRLHCGTKIYVLLPPSTHCWGKSTQFPMLLCGLEFLSVCRKYLFTESNLHRAVPNALTQLGPLWPFFTLFLKNCMMICFISANACYS